MSNKNVFLVLKDLVEVFRHCGWVNGLNEKQYAALEEANDLVEKVGKKSLRRVGDPVRAKKLRKDGYTIRQIATIMGYAHPGSIEYLLRPGNHRKKKLKNNL